MLYKSNSLPWLQLNINNDKINKDDLNTLLYQLDSPQINSDISLDNLNKIPNINLAQWIKYATILKQENVLDGMILNKFPLKQIKKIDTTKRNSVNWIDITGKEYPLNFVAWDTETTGLDLNKDNIIQLSAAKYEKGTLVDTFDTLLNPRRQLLPEISQLTGITTQQVLSAPDFNEKIDDFFNFISGYPLVGQNILEFDLPLLAIQCKKNNKKLMQYQVIDTLPLAKEAFPGRKRYSQEKLDIDLHLSELVQKKGYVKHNILHNSLNDSLTTAELYLIERYHLLKTNQRKHGI